MKNIPMLDAQDTPVRTQITLTKKLKSIIEQSAAKQNESLAEYLRKAALLRWQLEQNDLEERKKLAKDIIGSVNLKNHPEWSTKEKIHKWVRKLREEW